MRISDWSSDVCSSDLRTAPRLIPTKAAAGEADLQARGLSFADATALKQAEKDGRIKVHLWPVGRGAQLALYPNLNAVAPGWRAALREIGRAHVLTPVTNAQLVCRLLLEIKLNSRPRTHNTD